MATGNTSDFIKCPNGHLYPKSKGQCPFCPQTKADKEVSKEPTISYEKTGDDSRKTRPFENGTVENQKNKQVNNPVFQNKPSFDPGKTGFVEDYNSYKPTGMSDDLNGEQPQIRYTRKLVGVFFTRDIDAMGVVFNLFEGKNLIGRNDANCNIKVITDPLMSGRHAMLLNKGDQFILKDEMSAHGTFVNDEDISIDPHILKDGDAVRMGGTRFLFRSFL